MLPAFFLLMRTAHLTTYHETAVQIAKQAADILRHYYHKPDLLHQTKTTSIDLVTEADQAAEQYIASALLAAYPTHHIVGEEGSNLGAALEDAEYVWYVDPLDGTTNFANKLPMFCVSIAMTTREMQPLVGIVYNPITDEFFSAIKRQGATLNSKPIHVSHKTQLIESVLVSGFPYAKATTHDNNLTEWSTFLTRVRDLRHFGSAALNLCYVACGRFEGYWEQTLKPWDWLAGVLIVEEAGGVITDYTGNATPADYIHGRIVASNGHIHPPMLELIATARETIR